MESENHEELRRQLERWALRRGWGREDAEDLASTALSRSLSANFADPAVERPRFCFAAIHNLATDLRDSPYRRMTKRIGAALVSPAGRNALDQWQTPEGIAIGLREQRNKKALNAEDLGRLETNLGGFLYGTTGLGGEEIGRFSTCQILVRLLEWTAQPILRAALIDFLAGIVPMPMSVVPIDSVPEPATTSPAGSIDWGAVLGKILKLPFAARAALLLRLDEELLQPLLASSRALSLSSVLPEWVPPPPLEAKDLPIDDDVVAAKLKMTKSALHVMRLRVRRSLAIGIE